MLDPRMILSLFFGLSLAKKLLTILILVIILIFILYKCSLINLKPLLKNYKAIEVNFNLFILKIKNLLKI